MEARVPVSVSMSLALHFGGLTGWLYLQRAAAQTPMRVIPNVEFMRVRLPTSAQPAPMPRRAMPQLRSMKDFLKMALPSVPKAAPLEVKEPELQSKKLLVDVPEKIRDKGRMKQNLLDDKLVDAGRSHRLASLDASEVGTTHARRALADLPKLNLDEVGTRRASKAKIEMADMLQEQRGRLQAMDNSMPDVPKAPAHPMASMDAPLEDAAPRQKSSALSKLGDMLTSDEPSLPSARPMERRLAPKKEALDAADLPKKEAVHLATTKKKGVEIEGPLSNRKVVYYEIPQFPRWAADQGIPEADVKIRFYVDASGAVLSEGLRVEQTSGYGRLDRLATDVLKRWKFERIAEGSSRQWGIITFRFVLE